MQKIYEKFKPLGEWVYILYFPLVYIIKEKN